MPLETFRWFAMLRYEFVVFLMMTSFLLVKGLRIAMMYQGVNVEGLEAYGIIRSVFIRILITKHRMKFIGNTQQFIRPPELD